MEEQMRRIAIFLPLFILTISGCSGVHSRVKRADDQYTDHLAKGRYHLAMLELHTHMLVAEEESKRTGHSVAVHEGGAYANTLLTIASIGDAYWGQILDDPDIPYSYKIDLVFEILEFRLGKGAIYAGNSQNYIVPRKRRIDLEKEMIDLDH